MEELEVQTKDILEGKPVKKEMFPHQIAFNVFSHNSKISQDGYNEEETKMVKETNETLNDFESQSTIVRLTPSTVMNPFSTA